MNLKCDTIFDCSYIVNPKSIVYFSLSKTTKTLEDGRDPTSAYLLTIIVKVSHCPNSIRKFVANLTDTFCYSGKLSELEVMERALNMTRSTVKTLEQAWENS